MCKCYYCKFAVWSYEEYFGTREKEWYVVDCKKELSEEECKEEGAFEEYIDD